MSRLLFSLLIFGVAGFAQDTTTVSSVLNPNGSPGSGIAVFAISAPCISGTAFVDTVPITVQFNGVLTVGLIPNDTCVPLTGSTPTTYSATLTFAGDPVPLVETWCVPTSSTPLTIEAVIAACTSSSGSAGSWAAMTSSQWSGMTGSQWQSMGH